MTLDTSPTESISASRHLAQALDGLGVTHFFCVPVIVPGAVKEMIALGITPVMTHGEKAAAYMADGYARVSGRPGVCGAQTIGGTNLAAGLRDAYMARIPVVALTGGKRLESQYLNSYQEIDDMPIYDALTKFNATVWTPERLPDLLAAAFRAATTGAPQPVHLELSGFTGEAATSGTVAARAPIDARYGRYPASRPPADADLVETALAALLAAERPVLVVGGGARSSGAQSEIAELAHRLSMPVVTSLNAKNLFPETDALWLGHVGEYSMPSANQAVCEADLVLFVGSQTGGLVTRGWTVPPRAVQVVHIDIDPQSLGRAYPNTIGLCADARTALRQLLDLQPTPVERASWLNRAAEIKGGWLREAEQLESSDAVPMQVPRVCRELSAALPADAILVADTGHAGAWLGLHVRASDPRQTFIRAHGSLGWGFPAALGAKCAAPERPVVCFTGDGGFYYHLSELETAVRYGINVVVVVNNNASLNQEQFLWQESSDYDRNWRIESADFVALAESFGCLGIRADHPKDVGPALRTALAAGRPTVLEVTTDDASLPVPSWSPPGSPGMYASLGD